MSGATLNALESRPTHVRHWVILVTTLMSALLYLDRFCITIAERLIKEDLGLSNNQAAWMLSAFFWSYALAQVPSGWLSDRFGGRLMLTLYMVLWSLLTALTGLATGFVMLVVVRLCFGLAQAGAYPTASGVVRHWAPVISRGKASALIGFGGRLGGAVAPLATGYLIIALVPISVSSLLDADSFLDLPAFCKSLDKPKLSHEAVSRQVKDGLSSDSRQVIASFAAANASSDIQGDRSYLASDLNRLLGDAAFYDEEAFAGIALPPQAKVLLKRPREELSKPELERLNRLLLEAAYPSAIKKVYIAGWRPVLVVYGLSGLVVAVMFWWIVRNRPRQHPACNAQEVALIEAGQPQETHEEQVSGIPWAALLRSRNMWLSFISQAGTNVGWVFLVTLLPRYLDEVHAVPLETRGLMTAIPLFAGWFGLLYGGILTDRMVRTVGLRWGRALPLGLSRFLCVAAFVACLLPLKDWLGDWAPWALTAAFSLVAFGTDFGTPALWAFTQDAGGRHVGSVLGWGNMGGNLGAAISPPLLNWVIGNDGRWDLAFITCAAAFVVSALTGVGINATVPVVPEDEGRTVAKR